MFGFVLYVLYVLFVLLLLLFTLFKFLLVALYHNLKDVMFMFIITLHTNICFLQLIGTIYSLILQCCSL